VPKDRHERNARIHSHAKPNPGGDGTKYCVMNAAQVDEKAGKKQKKRKMEEDGECFNRPGEV
jgi:hypothetical protein